MVNSELHVEKPCGKQYTNHLKTLLQSNIILTSDISKSNTRLVRVVPCSQNAHTTHRLALFAIYYNKSNTENKIRIQKQNIKELA